jgi:hypothetical protein
MPGARGARRAAPAGAALQQTLQVPKFNGHRCTGLCFFMPPFPGVWAPGPPRISISSSLRFTYLLEALKTLDLWIRSTSSRQARGAPAPHPEFFKIFHAARRKGAPSPRAGAFSSHRFRTRGSAFLISRYSYLLIEASEFFLKVTNLHEIILIFIKL